MRIFRLPAVAIAALAAAGCPVDTREAETVPDTLIVAPPADPAALPEAARTVELQPEPGVDVAASTVVMPLGAQSQVSVHVRGAPPNAPLTAHLITGTCEAPGPLVADLEPVLTDAGGLGSSRTPVDVPPDMIINGNHLVLLTIDGLDGRRLACGRIPAHPSADPQPDGEAAGENAGND